VLPLEEITRKLDKKYGKMIVEDEINKIGEELNLREIQIKLINNVVLKPKELGKPSRRNTHFIRLSYVPARHTANFSFGLISRKTATFEEIGLIPISQT